MTLGLSRYLRLVRLVGSARNVNAAVHPPTPLQSDSSCAGSLTHNRPDDRVGGKCETSSTGAQDVLTPPRPQTTDILL